MSMDDRLNAADNSLDAWEKAQEVADERATEHKHKTSAQIDSYAVSMGIGKAKEHVQGMEEWYQRQREVDSTGIKAHFARMRYEQAIRRWETERSLFSAGKRVV